MAGRDKRNGFEDIYIGETPETKKEPKQPFSNSSLCVPDPTQGLGDTDVVRLKLVKTNRGGQSKGAQ